MTSSKGKIGWHFERSRGMLTHLPYEEHLNSDDAKIQTTFGREHIQNGSDASLREFIQNSIDANDEKKDPVKIKFRWISLQNDEFFRPYITELIPKLESMENVYDKKKVDLKNPNFLVVEDFNTCGLTGDFRPTAIEEDKPNNYFGFFYKLGYSGKAAVDSTSGGRRGIGRSVSAIVSSINTMFVLSKRCDDKKTFLKGMCLGKKFNENGISYHGYGYFDQYVDDNSDERSKPIFESGYIDTISKKLRIDRYDNFGTSTIIPYPDKKVDSTVIKIEVLKNYYVVISQGDLEIEISNFDGNKEEKETFNKDNILEQLKNNGLHDEHRYLSDFINDCFLNLSDPNFELPTTAADDGKIDKNDFSKDELIEIRNRFNNEELINLKAKINIRPKKHNNKETDKNYKEETFINLFFKKVDSNTNGKVYFQRGNMPLMGEGKLFNASAYGFMYAYDKPAVSFIAASEGTNHLKINTSQLDLKENYRPPYNIQATFIKKGLENLVNLMLLDEEEDNEFLKDYFTIADEENNEAIGVPIQEDPEDNDEDIEDDDDDIVKQPTTTGGIVGPIESNMKEIKVTRLKSKKGYKIKANKKNEQISSMFPMKIKFMCAYAEVGKKKSFKAHERLDFDFNNDEKIKIDMINAEIENKSSNEVSFKLNNEDFEISIYGFYEKFEVDIQVETIL